MTEVDPNSHPDQQTFGDLFEMFGTLTRYLQVPEHQVDEDLLQRLVESCDDAARYYRNEHCDLPPAWLVTMRELFASMVAKAQQHRVVSTGLH